MQPGERFFAVALEAAVLLRLDDEHAVARDALVAGGEKPRLDVLGERRGADVEAQMHRRGDLVDVLAPRALRADRAELDFGLGDRDCGGRARHSLYSALPRPPGGGQSRGGIGGLHAASASVNLNRPARGSRKEKP